MRKALTRGEFLRAGGGVLAGAYALGLAGCGGAGQGGGAGGSGWEPTQNVVMIIPFAPGGGSDILGRAMSAGLEQVRSGLNISVENRPAGSGAVGYSYLLEQTGDPHFLLASETTAVALPIATDAPFRWDDFTPVAQIGEDATLVVTRQDAPYGSLPEAIEAAKQERMNVGVTGATSLDAIVTALIERDQDVTFEEVVFESGAEIVTALLGGDLGIATLNPSEVIGQLESGDLRALSAVNEERYEGDLLADVPTAKEEGIDVTFTQYRGLFAAGGIQPEERKYWEDAIVAWTETKDYDDYIKDNFLIPLLRKGSQFEDYLEGYEKEVEAALKKGNQ